MNKVAIAVAAVVAGSSALLNSAQAEMYIGGKVGMTTLDDACYLNSPCDDEAFGAGLHIGYDFTDIIGLEYGVDFLGDYEGNSRSGANTINTIDGNLTALTLAPKFNWHLNDSWNLFAKIGGAYMMSDDETDFVPTGSLGAEYSIDRNWSVRAEYQRYQDMSDDVIEDMDSDFFGIGFNYKFGSEPVVQEKAVEEVVEARPATRIVDHVYPAQTTATVQFDLESAEVKDASNLSGTVDLMNTYPQAQVEITGYSDTTGSAAYNKQLTEKRAKAVADEFQAKGIAAERMTVKGMGEANPVASNETRQGRQMNRRVEVVVPAFEYQTTEKAE